MKWEVTKTDKARPLPDYAMAKNRSKGNMPPTYIGDNPYLQNDVGRASRANENIHPSHHAMLHSRVRLPARAVRSHQLYPTCSFNSTPLQIEPPIGSFENTVRCQRRPMRKGLESKLTHAKRPRRREAIDGVVAAALIDSTPANIRERRSERASMFWVTGPLNVATW
jgi:hypothetical protein